MRFIYLLFVIMIFPTGIKAQNNNTTKNNNYASEINSESINKEESIDGDSLNTMLVSPIMPMSMKMPFDMYGITPFYHNYANWELHKGFNASIGMSVSFSPSKYAPSGAGFGQDVTFMYALPINKRLSVAAGLYAANFDWGWIDYKNVGVAAVAAFRVNDIVTLYGYGNKSIMPQRTPMYYPIPNFTPDKIGGMVNFKIGESSSISIGLEGVKGGHPYYW